MQTWKNVPLCTLCSQHLKKHSICWLLWIIAKADGFSYFTRFMDWLVDWLIVVLSLRSLWLLVNPNGDQFTTVLNLEGETTNSQATFTWICSEINQYISIFLSLGSVSVWWSQQLLDGLPDIVYGHLWSPQDESYWPHMLILCSHLFLLPPCGQKQSIQV